jgi:flagellar motility protein MotE (MotC chaperone)
VKIFNRFEGQRQSIDHYGRQPGQDSQEKHEFKSLSVNPAEKKATKPADDDDDVDLFGDEDEEESEQTKQRLAAYAEKKGKSKLKDFYKTNQFFHCL